MKYEELTCETTVLGVDRESEDEAWFARLALPPGFQLPGDPSDHSITLSRGTQLFTGVVREQRVYLDDSSYSNALLTLLFVDDPPPIGSSFSLTIFLNSIEKVDMTS